MRNNSAKHRALKILLQNKLYSLNDCDALQQIIESTYFTMIEYKKHTNSAYVSELIKKLNLENEIEIHDSFLYLKKNLKFLFINSDLPKEDKCSLLRHELGHILDPDLRNGDISYSKIKKEEFANEFSLYVKNPGICFKVYVFMVKQWRLLLCTLILMACIFGSAFLFRPLGMQPTKPVSTNITSQENSDNTYYVTSSGKKYHRKSYITVKYRTNLTGYSINDAISNGYKPCLICLPEEKQVY